MIQLPRSVTRWPSAEGYIHPGHLGGRAAFIDEDQPLRVQARLGIEPSLTAGGYVRSILFGSVRRLFFRVTP
ncbi:hypothetical protein [Azospirillum argentinense]